jgi:phage repressor protein C with HTH and peptisase S24 domain
MMSVEMRRKTKPELPEWAVQITALRERMEINQAELARRMACSAMTISRWERGLLQPSAENYIQLGNLGNNTQAWFFWERAGIQPAKMVGALRGTSGFRKSDADPRKKSSPTVNKDANNGSMNVSVPLLKAFVAAYGLEGDKRSLRTIPAKETISVPAKWCPNPDYTSLLPVKGHTMEPLIRDGDLIAIDSFQAERENLYGTLVVATDHKTGLSLAYLRRIGAIDVLEGGDRTYEPLILGKPSGWRIVGKVLWWISSPNVSTGSGGRAR